MGRRRLLRVMVFVRRVVLRVWRCPVLPAVEATGYSDSESCASSERAAMLLLVVVDHVAPLEGRTLSPTIFPADGRAQHSKRPTQRLHWHQQAQQAN